MKRHENLRGLSRDHHHALVLARTLRAVEAQAPAEPERLIARVREQWADEIGPHFGLEERELLPLSDCGDEELRTHGQRIRSDHAQLREQLAALRASELRVQAPSFGALLEAHVRFEERVWFPSLEAALDLPTIEALAWRLQLEPESRITGYHRDEDEVWVAELDCGHRQHLRHAPPFQLTPWVNDEAGRVAHLGTRLRCPLCRMPRRPPCATIYEESPEYDEDSIPAGLLRNHRLPAGSWGEIVVTEGRVHYVLEDEDDLTLILCPGVLGVVAPERPHRLELAPGARLRVRLCRCSG